MNYELKAVVLAAGKGTRLRASDSDAPKVMREACGKPLLWYVLDAISFIEKEDTILIVGYKKESVMDRFGGYSYAFQEEQLGTGHAVMAAKEQLISYNGAVLVCYGDMPVIKSETYKALLQTHVRESNDCTLLIGSSDLALSYGRVVRDEDGAFERIIEEKDCTKEQLLITELNTGVYVFDTQKLLEALSKLRNNNSQSEYYITDVPGIMREQKQRIGVHKCVLGDEIIGVNTQEHLEMVEKILSNHRL